jgi:hypothetical protein
VKLVQLNEDGHQKLLFDWAHLARKTRPELRMLFAVPNGGLRHPAVAAQLKRTGLKPGVPDVMLAVARGCWHGLFIEMKVPASKLTGTRAGVTSMEQEMWLNDLFLEGYQVAVCYGWDQARQTILDYLDA